MIQRKPRREPRSTFAHRAAQRLAAWSLGVARLRAPRWLWWLPVLLAIAWIYAYFGSAGRPLKHWPVYMTEYDMLSDSFRRGHTYLPIVPHPALVAAENPYDPVNMNLWALDESYYKGRYYLYWGPVPALLQALVKGALRIDWTLGDQYIVYVSWLVATLAITWWLPRLSARLFGHVPRLLLLACVIAYAFANPILHLISTGGVYQAAISAGQCFLWVGVALASEMLFLAQTRRARFQNWLLVGFVFALAIGSRLSLLLAIAPIVAFTALLVAVSGEAQPTRRLRWRDALNAAVWMGLPIAACLGGLMLYNKARFDDYFESGIRLQLSIFPFRFSFAYFPANIHAYFFQTFNLSSEFPWLQQKGPLRGSGLPEWMEIPAGYMDVEPHVGLLRVVPIVWLAPLAFAPLFGVLRPKFWRRRGQHSALFAQACLCFVVAATLSAIPVWGLYVPSMRYLGDFTSGLVLLGILGGLALYAWSRTRTLARRLSAALIYTLSALTLVCGLLLGYQGYTGHFERKNPELHRVIKNALSF